MAAPIMIQGTMSNAGKSVLAGGLCRVFHQDGYQVAPFKSQNMALNSFITREGLEMGRAQVMQAEAAGVEPLAIMNPILLKPTNDTGSQVILNGEVQGVMSAMEYFRRKREYIPVNKPRCPFHAYHRDGAMRVDGNYGAAKGYEPNSFGEWKDSPEKKEPPLKVHGDVYNYNEREYDDDYYSQPGALFRLMPPEEQQLLFGNTARAMGNAQLFIKQRHVRNCYKADPAYGKGVAEALGISLEEALKEDR